MDIEVEIRSFVSKEKYEQLLEFFDKEGEFCYEDDQVSHYFDTEEDLRIMESKQYSKLWLKKGKMHDEKREEIEVRMDKKDFQKLRKIFLGIGLNVEIMWFRKRKAFKWQGINVMVDYTKGYGYILELEKICPPEEKEKNLELLKQKLAELNIPLTPRKEFDDAYEHYKNNWRELTGHKD